MKNQIVGFIRQYFAPFLRPGLKVLRDYVSSRHIRQETRKLSTLMPVAGQKRIFYLGITCHPNLGDMAQYYCISNWIRQNYSDYELTEIESDTVVDNRYGFIQYFKTLYRPCDQIIFQSGYTTQDLGGNHDLMHRLIIDNMPDANILMMPQTIYFQKEENKLRTAASYNTAKHMLFLARDLVSYEMATAMFPNIVVKVFPDIVTTLIGTFEFDYERKGICLCKRNDGEKYYSDKELMALTLQLEQLDHVTQTDTTIRESYRTIRKNLRHYIEAEIAKYAHYKVMITDRYHGTIFSLAAGTPVIILKTTDHKVVTGAEWFKGVYDNYVYVAEDLEQAQILCKELLSKDLSHKLTSYFKDHYYDFLKDLMFNVSTH